MEKNIIDTDKLKGGMFEHKAGRIITKLQYYWFLYDMAQHHSRLGLKLQKMNNNNAPKKAWPEHKGICHFKYFGLCKPFWFDRKTQINADQPFFRNQMKIKRSFFITYFIIF